MFGDRACDLMLRDRQVELEAAGHRFPAEPGDLYPERTSPLDNLMQKHPDTFTSPGPLNLLQHDGIRPEEPDEVFNFLQCGEVLFAGNPFDAPVNRHLDTFEYRIP